MTATTATAGIGSTTSAPLNILNANGPAPAPAPAPIDNTPVEIPERQRNELDRDLRRRLPQDSMKSVRRQALAANDWDLAAAYDQYTEILTRVMQGNAPPGSKSILILIFHLPY